MNCNDVGCSDLTRRKGQLPGEGSDLGEWKIEEWYRLITKKKLNCACANILVWIAGKIYFCEVVSEIKEGNVFNKEQIWFSPRTVLAHYAYKQIITTACLHTRPGRLILFRPFRLLIFTRKCNRFVNILCCVCFLAKQTANWCDVIKM